MGGGLVKPRGEKLYMAAKLGNAKAVEKLLGPHSSTAGDPAVLYQHREDLGATALHAATRGGHLRCVELLLEAGASVKQARRDGDTVLHTACHCYSPTSMAVLRALLKHASTGDCNTPNRSGHTSLHEVAMRVEGDEAEAGQLLIEHGADVARTDVSGATPLHCAAAVNGVAAAAMLLRNGADVNCFDTELNTPLHTAVTFGNIEMVGLLLRDRAMPTIANKEGHTPLQTAEDLEFEKICDLLKAHLRVRPTGDAPAHMSGEAPK